MKACPKRGHDLTLRGATETFADGKIRCVACRRIDDRARKRQAAAAKTHCAQGHAYTEATTRWVVRGSSRYRQCTACLKLADGDMRKRKKGDEIDVIVSANQALAILDLRVQRESATNYYERAEIDAKIAALQPNTCAPAGRSGQRFTQGAAQ